MTLKLNNCRCAEEIHEHVTLKASFNRSFGVKRLPIVLNIPKSYNLMYMYVVRRSQINTTFIVIGSLQMTRFEREPTILFKQNIFVLRNVNFI